jgi:hypothetical protein
MLVKRVFKFVERMLPRSATDLLKSGESPGLFGAHPRWRGAAMGNDARVSGWETMTADLEIATGAKAA